MCSFLLAFLELLFLILASATSHWLSLLALGFAIETLAWAAGLCVACLLHASTYLHTQ